MAKERPKWMTDELLKAVDTQQMRIEERVADYIDEQWWEFQVKHRLTERRLEMIRDEIVGL
jgi:hypothetical protein